MFVVDPAIRITHTLLYSAMIQTLTPKINILCCRTVPPLAHREGERVWKHDPQSIQLIIYRQFSPRSPQSPLQTVPSSHTNQLVYGRPRSQNPHHVAQDGWIQEYCVLVVSDNSLVFFYYVCTLSNIFFVGRTLPNLCPTGFVLLHSPSSKVDQELANSPMCDKLTVLIQLNNMQDYNTCRPVLNPVEGRFFSLALQWSHMVIGWADQ